MNNFLQESNEEQFENYYSYERWIGELDDIISCKSFINERVEADFDFCFSQNKKEEQNGVFNLSDSLNLEFGNEIFNDEISSVRGECEVQIEKKECSTKEVLSSKVINDLENIVDDLFKGQSKRESKKLADDLKCKQTKSNFQLKKLSEAYEKFPKKFPKSERIKLGKEIGLSETQIYKWYYDQKSKSCCKKTSDDSSDLWSEVTHPTEGKKTKIF